ncbi:pentatricopeptide repeat-containing protein [Tanacetum coccineum]
MFCSRLIKCISTRWQGSQATTGARLAYHSEALHPKDPKSAGSVRPTIVQSVRDKSCRKLSAAKHGVRACMMLNQALRTKERIQASTQVTVQTDEYGYLFISFMIQHEFITLTLAQFGQILKIPYNGQAVFTNEWDLASLEYSQETEGPYSTDLPTPDDIRRLLELERVMLSPDMKAMEELIRDKCQLGGHRDHLSACLAHIYIPTADLSYGMFLTRLYRHVMETYPHLDNNIYDIVDRVMRPLALKQTRRPRIDRGKARHSVSSSSSHHQGTSSHQHNDDDDDDDDDNVQTSRASTPYSTTYLNSLDPLNYQNYQMPSASEQTDETSLNDKPSCSTKCNKRIRRCAEVSNHLERH